MGHNIKCYGEYFEVPIFQDHNVADGEQVYIGNGQGCSTFWFKTVEEAKNFIEKFSQRIKVYDSGVVYALIPKAMCEACKNHYSYGTAKWRRAKENNCFQFKEYLKAQV